MPNARLALDTSASSSRSSAYVAVMRTWKSASRGASRTSTLTRVGSRGSTASGKDSACASTAASARRPSADRHASLNSSRTRASIVEISARGLERVSVSRSTTLGSRLARVDARLSSSHDATTRFTTVDLPDPGAPMNTRRAG